MILMLVLVSSIPIAMAGGGLTTSGLTTGGIGNEQYYSVYFDEEGDAIVMAKLTFQNTGTESLDFVVLEVPGQITVLNAVQEIVVQVKDDNYYRGYYETTEYYTVDLETETLSESTLLTVEFPEIIEEQDVATILLYYKITGLVEEEWGLYDFEFTTIKSSYDTYYVRVSAEAINGLYMEDVDSDINYQDWGFATSEMVEDMAVSVMAYEDSDMIVASSRIGYYGGFVREAYGLDPNESFTVSGKYATSEFRLHLIRNIILGLIGISLLVGLVVIIRKNLVSKKGTKSKLKSNMTLAGVSGLVVGLVFTLTTWASDNLYQWLDWQSANMVMTLLWFTTLIIGLIGVIGPGLGIGLQEKDWKLGMICFVSSLLSMLITTIIAIIFIALI